MVVASVLDTGDILVEVGGPHAPIVEVIPRHRGVVGEAELFQAEADGLRRQFSRLARGMAAEWGVRVIISGQRHKDLGSKPAGPVWLCHRPRNDARGRNYWVGAAAPALIAVLICSTTSSNAFFCGSVILGSWASLSNSAWAVSKVR